MKNDYENYQILVVDNDSTNNSMEHIKTWAERKQEVVYEELSFFEAIEVEAERLCMDDSQEKFYKSHCHNHSYINRGYYSEQIKEFLKYFKKENMMFIIFEDDFIKDKENTMNKLYDFLGVAKIKVDEQLQSNQSTMYKSKYLTNFLNKPSILKEPFKLIFTKNMREFIKDKLDKLNQKKLEDKSLSKEQKQELYQKYYVEEIDKLSKLLHRNLDNWYA